MDHQGTSGATRATASRDESEAHVKLLLERGVASAMGVGRNGIAFVDLLEASHRAQLARYRLIHLRHRAQIRERSIRLVIQFAYVIILTILIVAADEWNNLSFVPRSRGGWIALGFSLIGFIYITIQTWRLFALRAANARSEAIEGALGLFGDNQKADLS
jgi:hypothetical protein